MGNKYNKGSIYIVYLKANALYSTSMLEKTFNVEKKKNQD